MSRMTRAWLRATGCVLFGGAVLLAAPLSAQGSPPDDGAKPISLREAVEMAQRNAPAIVAANGLERVAGGARRAGLAAYAPTINLTAGQARTNGVQFFQGQLVPLTGNPWNYNNGLTTNLELFDGGRRANELRRVAATLNVADATLVQAQYDASLQVKQQYYAALAARESEAAARAQLEQAQQQLKASSARVAAGVATKSDSLRSAIQVGQAQLAVLTSQNDLRVANAVLTRVVGSPVPVAAIPSDTLEANAALPSETEIAAQAAQGPAVKLAEASVFAARATKNAQKSQYLPSLNMAFTYSFTQSSKTFSGSDLIIVGGGNPNRQNLNINFNYPLFNGFIREQQTLVNDVAQANAEAQLKDAKLASRSQLSTLLRALQNAQARVDVQLASIAAADEDLRVQQQRYALGASTLLDLLTSQTTLNQARQALIQARFDGRVARAQLSSLLGRPL